MFEKQEAAKTSASFYLASGSSALSIIRGSMGYTRKNSIPSLIGGLAFGSLFAISAWMINKKDSNGLKLYGVAAGILTLGMIPRAIKAGKRNLLPFIRNLFD